MGQNKELSVNNAVTSSKFSQFCPANFSPLNLEEV